MKLSFKFKPSISKKQLEIVEELSYHTTKLYNIIKRKWCKNLLRYRERIQVKLAL